MMCTRIGTMLGMPGNRISHIPADCHPPPEGIMAVQHCAAVMRLGQDPTNVFESVSCIQSMPKCTAAQGEFQADQTL